MDQLKHFKRSHQNTALFCQGQGFQFIPRLVVGGARKL